MSWGGSLYGEYDEEPDPDLGGGSPSQDLNDIIAGWGLAPGVGGEGTGGDIFTIPLGDWVNVPLWDNTVFGGVVTAWPSIFGGTPGSVGGGSSAPQGPSYEPLPDPYPDYEGEVSPETHPDLYEPPPYIPTPQEVYEQSVGGGGQDVDEGYVDDVVIAPEADEEADTTLEEDMAWTDWVIGAVDILDDGVYGNFTGPSLPPPVAPPAGTPGTVGVTGGVAPPAVGPTSNLKWNARTGRWECKRRRRRRLLTDSDFNDLMRISTLPSSKNVSLALAKAVGRRS